MVGRLIRGRMCDTGKVSVLGAGGGLALGAFATLSARGRKGALSEFMTPLR